MRVNDCVDAIDALIAKLVDTDDRVEIAKIKLEFDILKWLHGHQKDEDENEESNLEQFLG